MVVEVVVVVDRVGGGNVEAEGIHQSVGSDGIGGSHGFRVVVDLVVDVDGCGHQVLEVLASVGPGFHEPSSGVDGVRMVVEVDDQDPSSSSFSGAGGGVGNSGSDSEAKTLLTVLIRGYLVP